MSISRRRVILAFVVIFVAAPAASVGIWARLHPLEYRELTGRYDLWREGIKETQVGELHGYVRDHCKPKEVACSCVVLIHGLADNALTWKKILSVPAKGWNSPMKIYAIDLPGSGKSEPPAKLADYQVRRQAAAVRRAIEPVCASWIVAGNSLGGWIAAWMALDWPKGVNRLLLADSAGLKPDAETSKLHDSFFTKPSVESMKDFQRRAYKFPREIPDYVWKAVAERMGASNAPDVERAQIPDDYLDGKLQSLHRPTIVLWGDSDGITPESMGKRIREQIPGAVWRQAKDCGHLPQKECPLAIVSSLRELAVTGGM